MVTPLSQAAPQKTASVRAARSLRLRVTSKVCQKRHFQARSMPKSPDFSTLSLAKGKGVTLAGAPLCTLPGA